VHKSISLADFFKTSGYGEMLTVECVGAGNWPDAERKSLDSGAFG
jgi:hypothetical protein